jgi:hypothetical protein
MYFLSWYLCTGVTLVNEQENIFNLTYDTRSNTTMEYTGGVWSNYTGFMNVYK